MPAFARGLATRQQDAAVTSRDATRAGINITVTGGWKIFNYFIDTVFLVDMVIAFRTPSVPPPLPALVAAMRQLLRLSHICSLARREKVWGQ